MRTPPYVVGRSAGFSAGLSGPDTTRPIEWAQDPHASRTWCFEFHSLQWLQATHAETAADVALDWIHANPESAPACEMAWDDMAVARRGPTIARIAVEGLERGTVSKSQADTLRRAAIDHARWLADDAHYKPNNHGAYMDEGLLLLARSLSDLSEAAHWEALARERLQAVLSATIDQEAGLHLEHSPHYQGVMIYMLERLVELLPEYQDLLDRMRSTLAWLLTPTRQYAQIGDSPAGIVHRHVAEPSGMCRLPGFLSVRHGDSYLLVACGHHSRAHKHADDGSFVWFEDGHQLVCDTGPYSYDQRDPCRHRALSAQAHNTLVVDDWDWNRERGREAYGDGILAAHQEGDEAVVTVSHPHLVDARFTRTFRFRPGHLLIFDEVKAPRQREVARYFHVPTGAPVDVLDSSSADVRHEQQEGWTSPAFRERLPTTVHRLSASGGDLALITVLRARTGTQ